MSKKKVQKKPTDPWLSFRRAIALMTRGNIMQSGADYYRLSLGSPPNLYRFDVFRPSRYNQMWDKWEPAYWGCAAHLPRDKWRKVSAATTKAILDQVN